MMRKVLLAFIALFISLFLINTDNVNAQGVVDCESGALGCLINITIQPPTHSCDPGYEPPCGDPDNYQPCCQAQTPQECSDVACVLANGGGGCPASTTCQIAQSSICTSDLGGTTTDSCTLPGGITGNCCIPDGNMPSSCSSGATCFQMADETSCNDLAAGGTATWRLCASSSNFIGNCCFTSSAGDGSCQSGEICIDWGAAACSADGGYQSDCDSANSGSECCVPERVECPAEKSICKWVGGGDTQATCEANGGDYVEWCAIGGDDKNKGNCCTVGSGDAGNDNQYYCALAGSICYTVINSSDPSYPYGCTANFGHCVSGQPGCTACEDLSAANCLDGNPRACIEQNPSTGYFCDSGVFGCFPCFEGDTETRCNPPEYRGGTPEQNAADCEAACSGSTPKRFRCDSSLNECVEDGSGPYEGIGACLTECQYGAVTCSNGGVGINTAIGCIPVESMQGLAEFLISWGLGIAGGIAFLMIVYSGFLVVSSQGNPQRLQSGKELLTAALAGLMLIIFSATILRMIGADILKLPGL